LRRRADRYLGRLADAAHSLGYWDAEFSYDIDTQVEPAKVSVTVMRGLLYDVASIKVLEADGHPLSIPQDEKKLPLKPGDRHAPPRWWRPRRLFIVFVWVYYSARIPFCSAPSSRKPTVIKGGHAGNSLAAMTGTARFPIENLDR
jgi:hypothetical protein